VVYCAGPHCNATEKAAIRLAKLGRPVKKMIGGLKKIARPKFSCRATAFLRVLVFGYESDDPNQEI
jgi:hypothetical protein